MNHHRARGAFRRANNQITRRAIAVAISRRALFAFFAMSTSLAIAAPTCPTFFKTLVRVFELQTTKRGIEVSSHVKITELNGDMWNQLAVDIEHLHQNRDARLLLRDSTGQTVVFGKFATATVDYGFFYPLIESGPSGKRELVYHLLDQELGFDLTGRTVLGKLNDGEKVSLAEFHNGAISGEAARAEVRRAGEPDRLREYLEMAHDDLDAIKIAELVKQLRESEAQLLAHPPEQARIHQVTAASFHRMGLMDMILGQTDRHADNWMVLPDGSVKAIDNARILGIKMKFQALNTYGPGYMRPSMLGPVDAETKAKVLALTTERLGQILKENKIPKIYRTYAEKNLLRVQQMLRDGKSFETIIAESERVANNTFIPIAIRAASVAGAGAASSAAYLYLKDDEH